MQECASQLPLLKHLCFEGAKRKGLVSNSTKMSHYSMKPKAWTSSLHLFYVRLITESHCGEEIHPCSCHYRDKGTWWFQITTVNSKHLLFSPCWLIIERSWCEPGRAQWLLSSACSCGGFRPRRARSGGVKSGIKPHSLCNSLIMTALTKSLISLALWYSG